MYEYENIFKITKLGYAYIFNIDSHIYQYIIYNINIYIHIYMNLTFRSLICGKN